MHRFFAAPGRATFLLAVVALAAPAFPHHAHAQVGREVRELPVPPPFTADPNSSGDGFDYAGLNLPPDTSDPPLRDKVKE